MTPNRKATRDTLLTAGIPLLVAPFLMRQGVDAETAGAIGLATAWLVARGFRALRTRWPALGALLGG